MAYNATITRATPGLIIMLVDTSHSMSSSLDHGMSRMAFVADAINRAVGDLVTQCQKHDGVYDYFHIGLIAYSSGPTRSVFGGALAGRDIVPVSELRQNPLRTEQRTRRMHDGAGGLIEVPDEFDIWFDSKTGGSTDMCAAFRHTARIVEGWCRQNPHSFPPIVLHLTDGGATDEKGTETVGAAARALTSLQVEDGHVLLMTIHIGSEGRAIAYPSVAAELPPDRHAQAMFDCSSLLPPPLLKRAFQRGLKLQSGARGYVFNGRLEDIVLFLDIGTKAAGDLINPEDR